MALLLIITGLLMSMTSSMMSGWTANSARNERRDTGRLVLDRISRDLSQTTLPLSRASTNGLQFVINPTTLTSAFELPQAVFWQAPVATDGSTNGNLAVVGYFVQWVDGAPVLSRLLINPSATTNYLIYSNPTDWISDSLLESAAPASESANYTGLLAHNVLGLWVQALDPNGNPIQQQAGGLPGENFDSRYPYTYTNSTYGSTLLTNTPSAMPASLQIAIVVLDSRTAKLLTGSEKPNPASLTGNFWSDVHSFYSGLATNIQRGAEIQSTVVRLPAGPR